jgi:cytochrome c553
VIRRPVSPGAVAFRRQAKRTNRAAQLATLLLAAAVFASSARGETIAGDAVRGNIRSKAEQCQECHGEAGISTSEHYPKLAGQFSAYLRKQLNDFQSGARKSEIMTAMASGLSSQDIADIAAFFSGAPRWDAEEAEFIASGRALYEGGDYARGLPACQTCHGENGTGEIGADNKAPAPIIGGQRQLYLTSQLHLWKVGDRENSPGGVMNEVARKLTDAEIDQLARFLASQRTDR